RRAVRKELDPVHLPDADARDPDRGLVVESGDVLEMDLGRVRARLLPDVDVLDLEDQKPEQDKDDEEKRSDLGGRSHGLTSAPAPAEGAVSVTGASLSGSSSLSPLTNAATRGLFERSNSAGGRSISIFPSC